MWIICKEHLKSSNGIQCSHEDNSLDEIPIFTSITCICILNQSPQCLWLHTFHLDFFLSCFPYIISEHCCKVVRNRGENQSEYDTQHKRRETEEKKKTLINLMFVNLWFITLPFEETLRWEKHLKIDKVLHALVSLYE